MKNKGVAASVNKSTLTPPTRASAVGRSWSKSPPRSGIAHLVAAGSVDGPRRQIYPNFPFSPYASPSSSPTMSRRRPLRDTHAVSVEWRDGYTQLNQYKLKEDIGQVKNFRTT